MSMPAKKNISVIGCGYWGQNLIRNFSSLGCLHSISDTDFELVTSRANEFLVPHKTFAEILVCDDIEGVAIAAPAFMHSKLAIDLMNAGKHVFVEKPMAISLAEASDMIAASQKNETFLMIGHLLQYHPVFRQLRKMVENDEFGKLNYIYSNRLSFGKIRTEEDVVLSFAPHDISMILSLAGSEPMSVTRDSCSVLQKGIDDIARLHIEFVNGLKADINISWLNPTKEQKLVLIGEKGMAVFDDTLEWKHKLAIYRHQINLSTLEAIKTDPVFTEVPEAEPLKEECSYFCGVVEGTLHPITDGAEGYRVLSVLEAAESAKSGQKAFIV
jgi:UDP-2-acetamido-3-amino-2,3-dideoxy-glucuronate N-acetyltransferase